jgi:hypothetical protein
MQPYDASVVDRLRQSQLFGMWHNHEPMVHTVALEHDGRRRKKLLAGLVADGLLVEVPRGTGEPQYKTTPAVLNDLDPVAPNMVDKWDDCHRKGWNFWFLRTNHLTRAEWLHVVKGDARVRFYVVHCSPLEHSMSRYADEAGDPQESTNFNKCPWWGPFPTLAVAHQALKMAHTLPGHDRFEIVIGSPELAEHVESVKFEELVAEHYPQHFCWGLVKLGILTEAEVFQVEGDPNDANAKRTPRINVATGGGLILHSRTAHVSNDPAQWGQNVADSVTRLIDQLAEVQGQLVLMRKVELAVVKYGGWDKFLVEYRSALREALKKNKD